ncbi:MAG: ATP-binding protein [Proteobacteria bacterium]|nr:ATP-binding protein [Pseudomonadota bacterium]
MWIKRRIQDLIEANTDPIQVFRGPRQCGKTSLVLHVSPSFREISLDDGNIRSLAERDPELLLKQFDGENLFIDEAQYAPKLFPALKRRADLYKRSRPTKPKTILRITGSNQILLDRTVKESLAGRASFFDMNTLSVEEILNFRNVPIQQILYTGGWPELYNNPDNIREPNKYLDDYISSYIDRDIVLSAGIRRQKEFRKFVQMLAGRVGQQISFSSIGQECGIDTKTSIEWVSILEQMNTIRLVPPYSSNLTTRLVKSPKLFFIDTGLACRLQGWTSSSPILTSPQQGALFENLVFSEIYKLNLNLQLGWNIYHWRSRDGEEIDFLIECKSGQFLFLESKISSQPTKNISKLREVKRIFKSQVPRSILVHMEGDFVLADQVPIRHLADFLINFSQEIGTI